MATFNIRRQSGQIQNAETINNHAGAPAETARLLELLTQLLEDLRHQTHEGHVDSARATRAAAEIVEAVEEASLPDARPGRVRASLARAAEVLSDVAAASAMVGSLQAIVGSMPIG